MKKTHAVMGLTATFLMVFTTAVYANVKPATIFNSNMVLQREKPVPVWGTAKPGEQIEVKFNGQTLTTKADAAGKWEVTLSPMKVNAKGQDMVLKGKNTITLKNILVGDVWLCAGQSNMEMAMGSRVTDGNKHMPIL